MTIRRVLVVGFGRMGQGLTSWLACSGVSVVVQTRRATERCRTDFESAMMRMSERMKLGPDTVSEVLKRVNFVNDFDNNIDWIVECLEEDLRIKSEFLNSLSKNYSGIVSTNTSTLTVEALSTHVPNPSLFMGTHFLNPVPVMPLVEIISTDRTDYGAISTICEFLKEHGKIPVKVPDVHGFVVNRILFAALFQAMELMDAQPVTAHEIDTCMKEGCSWPMGPLALADYIGLDVCESIMKSLTQDTTFPYRNIPQTLQRLLGNGHLGRKNRKGFFNYD